MSEKPIAPVPVELTRSAYESLNRRDFDATIDAFGPASGWDVSRWGLGTHRGRVAIRRFLHDWFGSLDAFEVSIEELRDMGNGVVAAVVMQVAHSGNRGQVRLRSAPVFVWVAGRIQRLTVYPDLEEGRLAAERVALAGPQSNVDLHTRAFEAVNRGIVPEEILAPGFRMENHASAVTDHAYHGARGWREWMSDLFEVFAPGARYAVDEIVAADEDFVVASFSVRGQGARSREPLEFQWVGVTWFRDGKATRAVGYTTRREALGVVGLAV
jgi:ketosteroid isomerase-like protein